MSKFKGPTLEEIFKRTKYQIKNEIVYANDFAKIINFFYKKNKLNYIEELVLDYAEYAIVYYAMPFKTVHLIPVLQQLYSSNTKIEVLKYVTEVLARNDMYKVLKEFLFRADAEGESMKFKEIEEHINELLRGY